jgi:CubicO group peptidase (beta-lactamase class C family)
MLRSFSLCAIAAVLVTMMAFESVVHSQELAESIDAIFADWDDRLDVPGCAVGVVRDGELIYSRGFGSANLDYEVPNSPQTIFEIASFSKGFTTACIALLMDEGKITPETELHEVVPEMHRFDPPVRIRHMLRCHTGLWAQYHIMPLAGWDNLPVQGTYYKDDLLTVLSGQRTLPFEPGSEFQYGSADAFLLGIIVERISGQSLPEFALKRIFEPLDMSRTFYQPDPSRVVKNRAVGHYKEPDGTWRQWRNNGYVVGGGGVNTCIEDLHRWDQALENKQLPRGKYMDEFVHDGTVLGNRFVLDADAYLKKMSPEHFRDNPPGQYRGLKRIQFTGGFWGMTSAMARFPDEQLTVICLSNNDEISAIKKAQELADVCLSDKLAPRPPIAEKKYVEMSEAELANKAGAYQSEHGQLWRIDVKDGKLWNKNHINETYELKPLGENRFEPTAYPEDTFVFKRPSPDKPFALAVEWSGGSVPYRRVELARPSAAELEGYAGEFHSDELLVTYRFKVQDGSLWLRLHNRRWERLDPTVKDEFMPRIRTGHDVRMFKFGRNEAGRVTGLTVSFWRIRGVDFKRQP